MPALVLVFPERLTHVEARACLDMLLASLCDVQGETVTLDASLLSRFDSSALAVLLALLRACQTLGKSLRVIDMAPHLLELAELYGVEPLLHSVTTADA